ncbi:MAG: T9SS type A sorting domain-containing protein [Bacteroidetes bacterium]|nr:T9SS type A sorting domain-containing protein [Bacteroidota bacterium]
MKLSGRLFLLFALLCFAGQVQAGEHEGGKDKRTLQKTSKDDVYDFISINNILMWISNNGSTSHNPQTDGSGLEWPNGSAQYAIFQDGLVWGGKVQGEIRIGGSTYRQGLQAGNIKADGTAEPADPRHTIYKVRKVNRASFDRLTTEEQDRLRNDFENWPDEFGAPYYDKDNSGTYNPNFEAWLDGDPDVDTPFLIGDEVLWFVSNDLSSQRTTNLYGTPPIGVEVQTLVWGYNQTGPLGNMVFTKYTVINKGSQDLEEAYFAQWSDPDLGDAGDDLVGIDTTLSLGYCYNGLAVDGVYGIPPAIGYDFFQGPVVPGEAEDEAIYNFGTLPGWKNLEVSSFAFYINSDPVYADPDLGLPEGAIQMYNYLQSKLYDGRPFVDPTTGLEVQVTLAGDPVTKTGWIDGLVNAPDDRRFLMTTGPFTLNSSTDLANGKINTQEVVVSRIVGRGSDRISSLQVLRYFDRFAQLAFDNNFDLPQPPPQPKVSVSLQDNTILLSWADFNAVQQTENFEDNGYAFQGYNVYQFESQSATIDDAIRLGTFDLVDNVATIFDEVVDQKTGAVVTLPVQLGTDSGIERLIELTDDAITDRPLVNNQPYYFAVTAYSYNPDPEATPRQLESTPQIIEVRPQTLDPGYRVGAEYTEELQVMHTEGLATGSVHVSVVDPMELTGDSYAVTFENIGKITLDYYGEPVELDNYGWNLTNSTKNQRLITRASDYGGTELQQYVVDGFQIGLAGSGHWIQHEEIHSIEWIGGPNPYDFYAGYALIGDDFLGSSIMPWEVNKIIEIRFDENVRQKGYVYYRSGSPTYLTAGDGYYESPMTVWDVTDKDNHRQISFALVEWEGAPSNNFMFDPTFNPGDREYLFLIDVPYSDTPKPEWVAPDFRFTAPNTFDIPIVYAMWCIQNDNGDGSSTPWQNGDIWRWTPSFPFSSDDVFTFSTTAVTYTADAAREDINDIQVFPNPYLGSNEQELNKYQRFVTFNHLPPRANFRIYTVSGTLVRSFSKEDDGTQLATWDLQNDNGLPVASGMYIIHIDMPDLGAEKVLKLGVVSEAQYLDRI